MYKWIFKFISNCPEAKVKQNTKNILALTLYSKKVMHDLLSEHKIDFHHHNNGILHIYSEDKYMNSLLRQFEFQRELDSNFTFEKLDSNQCIEAEPALSDFASKLFGGVLCKLDEVGDVHDFTLALEKISKAEGVQFKYESDIKTLISSENKISGVIVGEELIRADAFLVCLGAYTAPLVKKLGIHVPIYPLKGYSITIPIEKDTKAPRIGITDGCKKLVYSRLGESEMRISGTAEFAGYSHGISDARIKPMIAGYQDRFPNGGSFENAKLWSCLRPQTPNNVPIIGKVGYSNLYINSGHGSLGWTMSMGSAKLISDIISEKTPDLELQLPDYGG